MLQLHFSTPKGVDYGVRKRSFRPMLQLHFSTPNYGVRKRSFRPMLQLHFSTPKGRRAAPLAREAGEGERQGAPPCAPTPLSHPVGEGLGQKAWLPSPTLWERGWG
jgi:hypothetical protein